MTKSKQFKELIKNVKNTYLGKPVKSKYKKKYGSIYDLDEIESIAYGIAKSKGVRIEK
jgi:hypothetical protein